MPAPSLRSRASRAILLPLSMLCGWVVLLSFLVSAVPAVAITVSGAVTTNGGQPLQGAQIVIEQVGGENAPWTAVSAADGSWSVNDLLLFGTLRITAAKAGCTMAPAQRDSFTHVNLANQNFVASSTAEIDVRESGGGVVPSGTSFTHSGTTGTAHSFSFVVKNAGTGTLSGLSAQLAGAGAVAFSIPAALPGTLAPGGEAALEVRFSSATAGSFAATLQIASSDSDENPCSIHFSVTANAPPPPSDGQLSLRDGAVTIRWISAADRYYTVSGTTDLMTWTPLRRLPGTGSIMEVVQPTGAASRAFFRLDFSPGVEAGLADFDAATSVLRVYGTAAGETLDIAQTGSVISINGGAFPILGGTPTIANTVRIEIFGGGGDDRLFNNADSVPALLVGGPGQDLLIGGQGNDTFAWSPGDGSDTIEGRGGEDSLIFAGSRVSEQFDLAANGSRLLLTRSIANIQLDCADLERIGIRALGGSDTVTVNDLSGTDVTAIDIDLHAAGGSGDGAVDQVIISGTGGDDVIVMAGDQSGVVVLGLAAQIIITGAEPAFDRLTVQCGAGDDVVEASGLGFGMLQLTANGGAGDDVILGGEGSDTLNGGDGDDVLNGGPGLDILDGGSGSNVLIQ